jgi:hypothetical protein
VFRDFTLWHPLATYQIRGVGRPFAPICGLNDGGKGFPDQEGDLKQKETKVTKMKMHP